MIDVPLSHPAGRVRGRLTRLHPVCAVRTLALDGEVKLKAVSGTLTDECAIRHVDAPNPAYKLQGKSSNSANWV